MRGIRTLLIGLLGGSHLAEVEQRQTLARVALDKGTVQRNALLGVLQRQVIVLHRRICARAIAVHFSE